MKKPTSDCGFFYAYKIANNSEVDAFYIFIMMDKFLHIILITIQNFLFSIILAPEIGLRWDIQNIATKQI